MGEDNENLYPFGMANGIKTGLSGSITVKKRGLQPPVCHFANYCINLPLLDISEKKCIFVSLTAKYEHSNRIAPKNIVYWIH